MPRYGIFPPSPVFAGFYREHLKNGLTKPFFAYILKSTYCEAVVCSPRFNKNPRFLLNNSFAGCQKAAGLFYTATSQEERVVSGNACIFRGCPFFSATAQTLRPVSFLVVFRGRWKRGAGWRAGGRRQPARCGRDERGCTFSWEIACPFPRAFILTAASSFL